MDIVPKRNFLQRNLSDSNVNIHGYDVTANSSCGWNKRKGGGGRTEVPPPMNIPVPDGGAAAERGGCRIGLIN